MQATWTVTAPFNNAIVLILKASSYLILKISAVPVHSTFSLWFITPKVYIQIKRQNQYNCTYLYSVANSAGTSNKLASVQASQYPENNVVEQICSDINGKYTTLHIPAYCNHNL